MKQHPRYRCYSLIELLVVIAVIVILAGILFPALRSARESARRAQCLANQKNLGVYVSQYAQNNNQKLSVISNWSTWYRDLLNANGGMKLNLVVLVCQARCVFTDLALSFTRLTGKAPLALFGESCRLFARCFQFLIEVNKAFFADTALFLCLGNGSVYVILFHGGDIVHEFALLVSGVTGVGDFDLFGLS